MSIWTKLGRTPGVIAVAMPSPTDEVGPLSAGPAARFDVEVVAAADPDGEVGPPPASATLAALCRAHLPALQPGMVALLADADDLDATALAIEDSGLRLGGAPIGDRAFALLRITLAGPAIELDDPAAADALTALGDRRRRLLAAYARDDRDAIDAALRDVLAGIAAEPRLDDRARKRLIAGFARELIARRKAGLGAIPRAVRGWTDFVADLPPVAALGAYDLTKILRDLPPPATVDPGDGLEAMRGAAEPPPVHWNTRVLDLDGHQPIGDDDLMVQCSYRLETKLDPAPADDAVASAPVPPGTVVDGTAVTFVVQCKQPVLRALGAEAWTQRVEGTVSYAVATGETAAVAVELRPTAAGKLHLALSLITDNAVRSTATFTLVARAAAAAVAGPSAPPAPSPVQTRPVAVAAASLSGPRAELLLELTAADQIRISTGATIALPCPLASAPSVLAQAAILARTGLAALSHDYRAASTDPAAPPFGLVGGRATMLAMARIGAALHEAMFGHPDEVGDANLKARAQLVADLPAAGTRARLQIAAAFQPYPWAVLYDGAWRGRPLTDEASLDPSCFWGRRFRIDRAIVGHGAAAGRGPTLAGPLRIQACINPHLDDQQAAHGVQVVAGQRALFAGLAGVEVEPAIESGAALRSYLQTQPRACDLLYFFCHATAAQTLDALFTFATEPPDTQARLILDAGAAAAVDVAAMRQLRRGPLADRPLVFLNACGSALGDPAFQAPLLVQFLDRWRATGVIGTDWEVPTVFADAFARRLLGYFLGGHEPLAEAFAHAAADAFAQDNPFPLIYALYAPPDLTFQPGASS